MCPCCSGIALACGGPGRGRWCLAAMRESGGVIEILEEAVLSCGNGDVGRER